MVLAGRFLRKGIKKGERIKGGGSEGRREGGGGMFKILTWKLEYLVLINM